MIDERQFTMRMQEDNFQKIKYIAKFFQDE